MKYSFMVSVCGVCGCGDVGVWVCVLSCISLHSKKTSILYFNRVYPSSWFTIKALKHLICLVLYLYNVLNKWDQDYPTLPEIVQLTLGENKVVIMILILKITGKVFN